MSMHFERVCQGQVAWMDVWMDGSMQPDVRIRMSEK